MQKKLFINRPFITGYKNHALPLAILVNNPELEKWVLCNFSQLYTRFNIFEDPYCDPHWLEFYMIDEIVRMDPNPLFVVEKIHNSFLNKSNIEDILCKSINQSAYIYLHYDGYYIPHDTNYKKKHFANNLLVYGFNQSSRLFDVLDYNSSTNNQLEELTIDYNILFDSILNFDFSGTKWAEYMYILKPRIEIKFSLGKDLVIQNIEDYMKSFPTYTRFGNHLSYGHNVRPVSEKAVFGLDVYNALEYYVGLLKNQRTYKNILPFYVFWEHKKCLVALGDYLYTHNFFKDAGVLNYFIDIEKKTLILRNLMLKYKISNNLKEINSMESLIKKLKILETEAMEILLDQLI